jgi:hypothetical protein
MRGCMLRQSVVPICCRATHPIAEQRLSQDYRNLAGQAVCGGTLMGTLGTLTEDEAFQERRIFAAAYPVEERWERWNAGASLKF